MQIHELNGFSGTLNTAYLAVDDGSDTGKKQVKDITDPLNARIDNIIAGGAAPSEAEIIDARLGADGVTYPSLGDAIRDQFTNVKEEIDYYSVTDKTNLLTPVSLVRGYMAIGGSIQAMSSYGYVKVNVESGVTYTSNITMRSVAGSDMEGITNYVTSWTATYTGVAYFNFTLSAVDADSYLCKSTEDLDLIGRYGHLALSNEILKQTLGNSEKVTMSQDAITKAITNTPTITYTSGYYMSVSQSAIRVGADHKVSNVLFLKKGQRITFTANGYGNGEVSVFGETDSSGQTLISSIVTSTGNSYQSVDYIATHDMYVRISIYGASTLPTVVIMSNAIDYSPSIAKVIEVGIGKDYTSLIDAIGSITDSSEMNPYTILLYEGTYNTIVAEDIDSSYVGLIIPDYVSIVGVGSRDNIVIKATCPSGYESYANNISTINFRDNGKLENVTIEATNIRYCNHDDYLSSNTKISRHQYINCKFIMNAVESGFDVTGACVGIGAMYDKQIVFDRCDFSNANNDNNSRCGILIHDSNGRNGCVLTVRSCKFSGGRFNMVISTNDEVLDNTVTLEGNLFSLPILVRTGGSATSNKFNIRAWGNKHFSYNLAGALTDISADVDAYANEA